MLRHLSFAFAAILSIAATPPATADAQSTAATPEWTFSAAPDRCTIYGKPGGAFVLLTINPEGEQGLRIHHPDIMIGNGEVRPLVLTIGDARLAFYVTGARTSDGTLGFIVGARSDLRAAFGAGTTAVVEIAPGDPLALDVSGLAALLPQLDACTAKLQPRDPATIVVVRPQIKAMPAISASDLPMAGVTRNEVGFRLTLSPQGRATRCEIIISSGSDTLDARVCNKLLAGARFTPARNAAGDPVVSTYQSRVVLGR